MTAITIEGVARTFGTVRAVDYVSIAVRDGEFFTLLGPSGCGKTTLLRMVAGFCELDQGRILFGEERIDTLPPHRRNTGMVFQNYAVFPNLTVGDNVAYGLRARKVPRNAIRDRVERALKLVQLDGYGERWPHQLSGGQLQRVAIARAVVIEPHVLLLDEPLSNLDAKLRVEMRGEIRRLQKLLGITVIYVTHDQEEALAISDRIAVMRAGRVEQIAAPRAIYERPETPFVASFVGTTNLLDGAIRSRDGDMAEIAFAGTAMQASGVPGKVGDRVVVSLRPEALRVLGPGDSATRRMGDAWRHAGRDRVSWARDAVHGAACRQCADPPDGACAACGLGRRHGRLRSATRRRHGAGRMMLFVRRHAFPLAVGAVATAFLGLFFLLPLLKVFGASILDASGKSFTLANYVNVLSNRFFLNGLANSLSIAAAASVLAVLVGVPFAFCLARLPIGGKPVLLALAALPLVLPSFVGAYALVLLFGRSGIVTGALQALGIPFELNLWREGHRPRLHAHALSLCRAAGHGRLQIGR